MILLIDGRSGTGKTSYARDLAAADPSWSVLHLDEIYPGWDGLDAASTALPGILQSRRWQSWDWEHDRPGSWHALPDGNLIVEGVGAISRASRALADRAIWLEASDDVRKDRALTRDGDMFAPHWDRWASQEEALIARENPRELADEIIDTTHSWPLGGREG